MNRFSVLSLMFCVLTLSLAKAIQAGMWTEDFKAAHLNSWTKQEHQRERVIWQPKNGRLDVQAKSFCLGNLNLQGRLALKSHYTLAFTAFPIEADQLHIKLTVVRAKNANVGIFIGKQPESLFVNPLGSTYQFADHLIGGPLEMPIKHPHIELALKEIEVVFEQGVFELFSRGEKIVDFQDESFQTVNYLGIAVFLKRCALDATAVVDDFVISGPSIPNGRSWDVHSKNKAAVIWGALKRH